MLSCLGRILETRNQYIRSTLRRCSNERITKVFNVSSPCTINGFISHNTIITPHSSETESETVILKSAKPIIGNQIGSSLNLTSARDSFDPSQKVELLVPFKASKYFANKSKAKTVLSLLEDLNITTLGNLEVYDSQADFIHLFSENGAVIIGNLKSSDIQVGTNDVDIVTRGTLESSRIDLLCRKKGSIKAENLKTLGLKMETNEGDIAMNSCYSKQSYFVSKTGNMTLRNVHNRCRVEVLKQGKVKMLGLDGALHVLLQNGEADLQIEKLCDDSDILVREEGTITLHISPELLEHCEILIWSKGCNVDDELPFMEDEASNLTTVRKVEANPKHTLRVRCVKATCNVRLASWADLIKKEMCAKLKEINC